MSQEQASTPHSETPKKGEPPKPVLHRVCIQCNNMFRVTPENYDLKHCPNCHKG